MIKISMQYFGGGSTKSGGGGGGGSSTKSQVHVGEEMLMQQGMAVTSMTVIDIDEREGIYTLRPTSQVDFDAFDGYGDPSNDIFVDLDYIKRNRLRNTGK